MSFFNMGFPAAAAAQFANMYRPPGANPAAAAGSAYPQPGAAAGASAFAMPQFAAAPAAATQYSPYAAAAAFNPYAAAYNPYAAYMAAAAAASSSAAGYTNPQAFQPPQTSSAPPSSYAASYKATGPSAVATIALTYPTNSSSSSGSHYGGSSVSSFGGGGRFNSGKKSFSTGRPLHYCDVCKISCAGPQTYKEHLEGQKHKKKEQIAKSGLPQSQVVLRPGMKTYYCELCDVTCTSTDTYNAHARGAKHQKVVKLYQRLNKPIPPAKEVIVKTTGSGGDSSPTVVTQKISANSGRSSTKSTSAYSSRPISSTGVNRANGTEDGTEEEPEFVSSTYMEDGILKDDQDPEPVGNEYIEESKDSDGKIVQFNCKLCECKFNDPYAKDMHLKGRRHRLMYKRKVNPELAVDFKPNFRMKRIMDDRARRQRQRDDLRKRHVEEQAMRMEMRRMEEDLFIRFGSSAQSGVKPETWDDRHVLAKHQLIYPTESELEAVQEMVSLAEKALKLVSDRLAEEDMKDPEMIDRVKALKELEAIENGEDETGEEGGSSESTKDAKANGTSDGEKKDGEDEKPTGTEKGTSDTKDNPEDSTAPREKEIDSAFRQLKGVMRIGPLAKGLLLKGDKMVELAVLCQERPTKRLLARVFKCLSSVIPELTEDMFTYEVKVEDCAIVLTSTKEPNIQLKASLTSPTVPEGLSDPDGKADPNLLNKARCLALLTELRRAKWFQNRANILASCVIVMRIMKDIMRRVPSWAPLQQWTMEVLVEKAIASAPAPQSPGEALRRVFECIASGALLPHGTGLYDPCDKDCMDAGRDLKLQDREDITASGQHALRFLAFRQIHKVLGIEMLDPNSPTTRKRRRDDEEADSGDKKDRRENEEEAEASQEDRAQNPDQEDPSNEDASSAPEYVSDNQSGSYPAERPAAPPPFRPIASSSTPGSGSSQPSSAPGAAIAQQKPQIW